MLGCHWWGIRRPIGLLISRRLCQEACRAIEDPDVKTINLLNYAQDGWHQAAGGLADVHSAVTGDVIARTGSDGLDFKAMLDHARTVGGPALRAMTFHERAWMLKNLANAVMARKEELYALS